MIVGPSLCPTRSSEARGPGTRVQLLWWVFSPSDRLPQILGSLVPWRWSRRVPWSGLHGSLCAGEEGLRGTCSDLVA